MLGPHLLGLPFFLLKSRFENLGLLLQFFDLGFSHRCFDLIEANLIRLRMIDGVLADGSRDDPIRDGHLLPLLLNLILELLELLELDILDSEFLPGFLRITKPCHNEILSGNSERKDRIGYFGKQGWKRSSRTPCPPSFSLRRKRTLSTASTTCPSSLCAMTSH